MSEQKGLDHLNSEEVEELYRRYIEGEKNEALISEYKINCSANMLYSLFPPITLDDRCPYCHISMTKTRPSKTAKNGGIPTCGQCKHKIPHPSRYHQQVCNCVGCITIREIEEERIRNETRSKIISLYDIDQHTPIFYESISFTHKVYLLALLRAQTGERFDSIHSLEGSRCEPFSPTIAKDLSILENLSEIKLLVPNPNSTEHAFDSASDYRSYDLFRVDWIPNIKTIDQAERLSLDELWKLLHDELSQHPKLGWKEEIKELLFDIAVEEVVQQLAVKLSENHMEPSAEKRTRIIVRELLEEFAVREIFYFTRLASDKAALSFYQGKTKGKKHATNWIPKMLSDYGNSSLSENWDRYTYHRTSQYPRSSLSYILNELVLKDTDQGFERPIGRYWNEVLLPKWFGEDYPHESNSRLACNECGSIQITTTMRDDNIFVTCKDCDAFVTYSVGS